MVLAIVAVYLLVVMAIAFRVSGGARDVEGYSVGNRDLPGWAVGCSVLGTFLSSMTFLGYPAGAFAGNWNAWVFGLALPVAAGAAALWFVPLYRSSVQLSAYELVHDRFGVWARCYAAAAYIALQLVRVAMVQLLVAFALAPLIDGWNADTATKVQAVILVSGLAVIVYDVVGGMRAVVWTDVLQVVVLTIGAAWCLALLWSHVGPQWDQLAAAHGEKFRLGRPLGTIDAAGGLAPWLIGALSAPTVLVMLIYGVSENLRNYAADQNYVQRMLAARDGRAAARSIWLAALAYLPLSAGFCLIGTLLYFHYGLAPPPELADARPEEVFPYFIRNELPPLAAGLVIAAILAAAMSTIDSSLNSSSTVLLVDAVRPLRRGRVGKYDVIWLRATTVLCGVGATAASLAIYREYGDRAAAMIDVWWKLAGMAGGGMFGLFLLAWLTPRLPSWAALISVAASIPVLWWGGGCPGVPRDWAARAWLDDHPYPLDGKLVGVTASLVVLGLGGVFRLILPPTNRRSGPRADAAGDCPGAGADV